MDAAHPTSAFHWTKPHEIAVGEGWICWHRPAKVTTVFINGKMRRAWIPPLVFVGGRHVRVWACDKINGERTRLYLPGWSNTYATGGVCWGSGRVPTDLNPGSWEDAFFSSSFSSDQNLTKTKPYAYNKTLKPAGHLGKALAALR